MKTKQTAEPIYTVKDILKYRKAAYLRASILHATEAHLIRDLPKEGGNSVFAINQTAFQSLTEFFNPFLPCLTIQAMRTIYKVFVADAARKRTERLRSRPVPRPTERLYPLAGLKPYDNFAKYVWEKREKPDFKKKIINGAIWGRPCTNTNGKRGWDKVIRSRFIGCEISTNLRGKKFLKLSIAD